MHRRTATATATATAAAAAALTLAAPALADVVRAGGEVHRYEHAGATPPPLATVPPGATARVHSVETGSGKTIVTLHVSGFQPSTRYGAHAHVAPCGGPTGLGAGAHYQDVVDPAAGPGRPSVDARYANPDNEVWLDVTTNRAGQGHAKSVVDWQFRPSDAGRSVIVHEMPTLTTEGKHGTAGKRVACLDVGF